MEADKFRDALKQVGKRVSELAQNITNEEQTKNAFIMPFFNIHSIRFISVHPGYIGTIPVIIVFDSVPYMIRTACEGYFKSCGAAKQGVSVCVSCTDGFSGY